MVIEAAPTIAPVPLPWLAAPLREALQTQRAHALLVHGPQGVGQFEMALTLAQAWLCESPLSDDAARACGHCASWDAAGVGCGTCGYPATRPAAARRSTAG